MSYFFKWKDPRDSVPNIRALITMFRFMYGREPLIIGELLSLWDNMKGERNANV